MTTSFLVAAMDMVALVASNDCAACQGIAGLIPWIQCMIDKEVQTALARQAIMRARHAHSRTSAKAELNPIRSQAGRSAHQTKIILLMRPYIFEIHSFSHGQHHHCRKNTTYKLGRICSCRRFTGSYISVVSNLSTSDSCPVVATNLSAFGTPFGN